jgi:hypothetical protein
MAKLRWRKAMFWCFCILVAFGAALWVAFRPAVANHFGYALPTQNGLPCRIHVGGRDYDNTEQCAGISRSSWALWYDALHHIQPGGSCETSATLRSQGALPLREIDSIWTLLGSAHSVQVPANMNLAKYTTTVLFVKDGACYRPYGLSGGP